MLSNKFFPYSSMQEINLDWILTKIKNILRFVPDDGAVGQILRRTAHGAEWSNEQGGGGAVDSVNGQTGTVVLGKSDVGLGNVDNVQQYSASNPPPYPVTSVNGQTGAVVVSGGAVDSVNGQTGTVVLGKSDVGLGNVDNVQQYSSSNPPPYPVTSVNGQTGAVGITYTNPHTLTGFASADGFKSVLSDLTDTLSMGQFIPVYANLSSITLTPFYQTSYSGFISKLSSNRSWGLMSDAFGVLVLLTEKDNVWTFTSK